MSYIDDFAYQMNRQFWGEGHYRFIFNTYINHPRVFGGLISVVDDLRKVVEDYSLEGSVKLDFEKIEEFAQHQQEQGFKLPSKPVDFEQKTIKVKLSTSKLRAHIAKRDGQDGRKQTTANMVVFGGSAIKLISDYAHQIGLLDDGEIMNKYSPYSSDIDVRSTFTISPLDSSYIDPWNVHWPKERQELVTNYIKGLFRHLCDSCSGKKEIFVDLAKSIARDVKEYEGYESCRFVEIATIKTRKWFKCLEGNGEIIAGPYIVPDSNVVVHAAYIDNLVKLQLTNFFMLKGELVSEHILEFIYTLSANAIQQPTFGLQLELGSLQPVIDPYNLVVIGQYDALRSRSQKTLELLLQEREWAFVYGKCSQQMARVQFLQALTKKIFNLPHSNPLSESLKILFNLTPSTNIMPDGNKMVDVFYCCPFFQLESDSRNHCRQIAEGLSDEYLNREIKQRLAKKLHWLVSGWTRDDVEQLIEDLPIPIVNRYWSHFVANNYNFYRTALYITEEL